MEFQAARFYERAAAQTTDVEIRKLLGDLAEVEKSHGRHAGELERSLLTEEAKQEEASTSHRMFVLQYVQPGLAGLMDGSVSTLAPLFAAAFATHSNWETFLVGMAASIGAGISMGFAEALSDDGALTGRGSPWLRGTICGLMTTLGGIGHVQFRQMDGARPTRRQFQQGRGLSSGGDHPVAAFEGGLGKRAAKSAGTTRDQPNFFGHGRIHSVPTGIGTAEMGARDRPEVAEGPAGRGSAPQPSTCAPRG
jgi:rubrerythrin